MNIGIASPVEIAPLRKHFTKLTDKDLGLGLGGTAINILIDGFLKAGHFVTVFTLDPTITNKYILTGNRIKVIFGGFRTHSKAKAFDFCRKEFKTIRELIEEERENLDIVNAHWSYEFAIGTILSKVPHLVTFRDHSQTVLKHLRHPYRLTRLLMDFWVRNNTIFFNYNSPYLKSLIGLEGVVIPNPIRESDLMSSKQLPSNIEKRKICYIANGWDRRKNPESGIKAFNLLKKEFPGIEFHLFGQGCEPDGKNSTRIMKTGLGDGIIFRGSLSHDKLMDELESFDVLLHTAREESFGNNLIEAMAKGIPVVAGQSSGAIPWVLDNGRSGCLTDIESPDKIYTALKRIFTDKTYYETLSKNGILNIKTRFLQERVCEAYINEYKKIKQCHNDSTTHI